MERLSGPDLTVVDLSALLRKKKVSCEEVVRLYLDRIEKVNPRINAFITVCQESALSAAHQADKEIARGNYRGPLHGIPFAVKDQLWTKGIRTTNGSRLFAEFIPDRDATVVARMKAAGAILLGKLNMMEFGYGPTLKPPFGVPRNPWDLDRSAGGSSSGSASAVAAALCPVTLGADAGGSIRLPAAFCGVVGLKPTWGRVSRHGLMGFGGWFDSAGPLGMTARDCASVLQSIAGYDRNDPRSSRTAVPDYLRACKGGIRGMRIGVVKELMATSFLEAEVRDLVSEAVAVFEQLGARVENVSIPRIELASTAQTAIAEPEAAALYRPYLISRPQDIDVFPRCRLITASLLPGVFRPRAIRFVEYLRGRIDETFRNVDMLLSPTTTAVASAVPKARICSKEEAWMTVFGGRTAFTSPFSLTGHPALSVPCGFTNQNLPTALQLVGRQYQEQDVLRAGAAYQTLTDWHRRRATLNA